MQATRSISPAVPRERLLLALGVVAASFVGIAALFTPYPFIAPFLIIAFMGGLVVIRFPELAVYGILVGVFFTGGDNPLSPLKIHGMIKLGAPLLMLWAIARAIGAREQKLASHQKIALALGVAFSVYAVISWLSIRHTIPEQSALIILRLSVSISLFVSIILLQDRLKLDFLMLAFVSGAVISSILAIPLETAHIENGREAGFLGDPNLYSAYLVASVPLAASFYFRNRSLAIRLLALIALVFIIVSILKTASRAGLIGCVLGVLASFAVSFRSQLAEWRQMVVVGSIAAVAGVIVIIPQANNIFDRGDSIEIVTSVGSLDRSTARRLSYIDVGVKLISEDPFLGNGTGSFPKAFAESNYSKMFMTSQEVFPLYRRAHNSFLEVFAELGLVGFALFGGVHALSALSASNAMRNLSLRRNQMRPHAAAFLGISLVCLWLMMITLSLQEMYVVWIFSALCLIANKPENSIAG